MISDLRFELSFKNIVQLERKLSFCKDNGIKNINIPCKGILKKDFFELTFEHINKNYREFNVTYHYSLYHQFTKNKKISYYELLKFIRKCNTIKNIDILIVSGSNKKKNYDVVGVLDCLKKENDLKMKFGIAYNPYLEKHFSINSERERFLQKISSGLINSIWLQFGTDIETLKSELSYLKKFYRDDKIFIFGSILIPSKQFIARFKFRPWKEVHISDKYLYSLENFCKFTKVLIKFYIDNNIIPVIETECSSKKNLDILSSYLYE